MPLLDSRYDAIISVLGNSHYHNQVFDVFERSGGPCILHDSRLTQIYCARLGRERFAQFASQLVGRDVSSGELDSWLHDHDPATFFLEPVIERASPLFVHTWTQRQLIQKRYGVEPEVLPACPTKFFQPQELTRTAAHRARKRRGLSEKSFCIGTFGYPARAKGMISCILALELLRSWNIPAELYFVGNATEVKSDIERIAGDYGVSQHVHCGAKFTGEEAYREFLIACDAAVQLRTYAFGQLSAALTDCISAGLPSVASADLAASCDSPAYVRTVPDRFSPLEVAEKLAAIWEAGVTTHSTEEQRQEYLQTHNFRQYSLKLLQLLGLR